VEGVENNGRCYILLGETEKFPALKVPMQYPIVLLVKVGWRGCKALGSKEGKGLGIYIF
jgi:hypothetical protein